MGTGELPLAGPKRMLAVLAMPVAVFASGDVAIAEPGSPVEPSPAATSGMSMPWWTPGGCFGSRLTLC